MAQDSFIFGGNSGLTYEELVRRRAIAAALAGRNRAFPKTKGEGLTYLGDSFAEAMGELSLQMKERQYKKEQGEIGANAPKSGSYVPASDRMTAPPGSDANRDVDRPTQKVEQPPARVDQPVETAPQAAPAPAATGGWDPPPQTMAPWPVSEAPDTFSNRFAAANAPPPDAVPVQTAAVAPPAFSDRYAAVNERPLQAPPVQTAAAPRPQISSDMQAMFFSPQMGRSELAGGRTADTSPAVVPPVQTAALPPDAVTLPTETADIPLPRGNPRTTGGVQATIEATLARGGATPNTIGGYIRNARDESALNPASMTYNDQKNFSGEARHGHGLLSEGGDEWNNQVAWLDKNYPGYDWRDPKLQAEFWQQRMQDPSRADYNRAYTAMQGAPTTGRAADIALRSYLKPADQYLQQRSATYLREGGEGSPQYASRAVTGSGGSGIAMAGARTGNTASGREGGSPADQRDAVTAALLQQNTQPQQVQAAPTQDEASADSRLLEAVGGGRKPGSPFYAPTAALGRAGVTSDVAQPGLSPMGSLGGTGVDASVEQRRNAISDALQNQPAPVPEVPPENPTQPGTSLSPTTASLPPSTPTSEVVSSDAARAPPMGATAQAGIPLAPPVGYGNMRVAQEPGPAMPSTSQGIRPAPPPAPDAPPSALPIPPETVQEFPKYAPAPQEPRTFGPSEQQKYWEQFLNHPDPRVAAKAKHVYETEETYRKASEARSFEKYKNDREAYEANVRAERDFNLKKPERELDTRIKRLAIEEQIAKASNRPEEALKLKADRQTAEQQLEDLRYKAGVQRQQEEKQRELNIRKTEQEIKAGKAPPREKIGENLFERQEDGSWMDVTPGSKIGNIKLTETQAKTLKFYERAKIAESQLGDTSVLAGFKNSAAGRVPMVGNYFVTPEYQKAKSAADAWMLATLRDESGAVIGVAELPQFYPVYFPLPGDSPQTIADKNQRRANATQSLVDALGSAKPAVDQFNEQFKARETTEPEGTTRTSKSDPTRRQRVRNGRWEDF